MSSYINAVIQLTLHFITFSFPFLLARISDSLWLATSKHNSKEFSLNPASLRIIFTIDLFPFQIMRCSATTGYLASLVATFVVVTMSLPQSPAGPSEVISSRTNRNDPFNYQPPKNCPRVGATKYKHDVDSGLKGRDLQSPETHTGALDPRMEIHPLLPCGIVPAGGQSDPFGFPDTRTVRLLWNLGGAAVLHSVLKWSGSCKSWEMVEM